MKNYMEANPIKMKVECIFCGTNIYSGRRLKLGETVHCNCCASQFEVINIEPLSIEWLHYDPEDIGYFYEGEDEEEKIVSFYENYR